MQEQIQYSSDDVAAEERLFKRVKIGTLVLMSVFIIHIFLPGQEFWPIMRWPMFSLAGTTVPSNVSKTELVVLTGGGESFTFEPGDLYSVGNPQSGIRTIDWAFDNDNVFQEHRYRTILVNRLQTLLPDREIEQVQVWRTLWNVERNSFPPIQLDTPDHVTMTGRFPAGYYLDSITSPEIESQLIFDETLTLSSFLLLTHDSTQPCDQIDMVSWWQPQQVALTDYHITGVIVDSSGIGVARHDGPLADQRSSLWPIGDTLSDLRSIPVPCDLPSGQYDLLFALYDPETVQNVPITYSDGSPYGDFAYLTTITVEEIE